MVSYFDYIYIEKTTIVYIIHIIRKEWIILFAAIQGIRIVIETVVKIYNNGLATWMPPTWLRRIKYDVQNTKTGFTRPNIIKKISSSTPMSFSMSLV